MQSFSRLTTYQERLQFLETCIIRPSCQYAPERTSLAGADCEKLEQELVRFLQEHSAIACRFLDTVRHQGSGLLPCSQEILLSALSARYGQQAALFCTVFPVPDAAGTTYLAPEFHVWSIFGKEGGDDIFLELVNRDGQHSFLSKKIIEGAGIPVRTSSLSAANWLAQSGIPVRHLPGSGS